MSTYLVLGMIEMIFSSFIHYFWFYDSTYKYIGLINTFNYIWLLSNILYVVEQNYGKC